MENSHNPHQQASTPSVEAVRAALRCGRSGCDCARSTRHVHCPAHEDEQPSLSVDPGRKAGVVFRCWAGCSQEAVLAALRARGLWPARARRVVCSYPRRPRRESVKPGKPPARGDGLSPDGTGGSAPTPAPGTGFHIVSGALKARETRPPARGDGLSPDGTGGSAPTPAPGTGEVTASQAEDGVRPRETHREARGDGLSADVTVGSAPTPAPGSGDFTVSRPDPKRQTHTTLTLTDLAEAKRLPAEFLRQLGVRDVRLHGRPAVAIPYLDQDGTELALRYRLSLAGDQRFRWQRGAGVALYGRQRLAEARRAGWVLIVEGESDCWTAWYHGLPALGVPGKSCWRAEWREALAGLEVCVWQEPDAADFSARIGRDIPTVKVIVAPAGIKDLSEAHIAGEDVPALLARLRAAARPIGEALAAERAAQLAALEAAAAPVLGSDPIAAIRTELQRIGYGGDLTPALITYLCLTTRLLAMRPGAMPAHLLLIGPPSAGKSYTLQTVLCLFPPDAYHVIDAGSPRVLIYDTADLEHRALIFAESDSLPAGEDNPAASAIRNLLQDHRLHYAVTVRDPETGVFTVQDIDRPGPTVLITTAVRELGGQLGSRVFTLAVPEDVSKLQAALMTQAALEMDGAAPPGAALIALQASLQHRAPWDVVVPFVERLAHVIGQSANASRILRDFQRLLALIKAVAILRERHRERLAGGRLVATIDDYATVYGLIGPMYDASITGATAQVRRVVEAVRALRAQGVERVTYTAVSRAVGLHPEQIRRLVRAAIKHGWLANRAERPHQAANLDLAEEMPTTVGLPRPEELVRGTNGAGDREALELLTPPGGNGPTAAPPPARAAEAVDPDAEARRAMAEGA